MKTIQKPLNVISIKVILLMALFTINPIFSNAIEKNNNSTQDQETTTINEIKGKIIDTETKEALVFATISIENTNIATIANSEGEFIIKLSENLSNEKIKFSFLGYKTKFLTLADLKTNNRNKIEMERLTVSLAEINVFPRDPLTIIKAVLEKRKQNYQDEPILATSFYRETIQKKRRYVSLSEAVLKINKQSATSFKTDQVQIYKGRKSVDYERLDTLAFKLQGGPHTALMLDIMRNPYMILDYSELDFYDFEFKNITKVNDKIIFVIGFAQRKIIEEPLFYGQLYIDSETMAITQAAYHMNMTNKYAVTNMFIKKRPIGADVYPTETTYMVKYREKDGKLYHSYSRAQITFKVDWHKKLFNSNYTTTIEMAITDWKSDDTKPFKGTDRLKMNAIMTEAVSGFSDTNFWGEYNYIEPEKSIENAIKKIGKKIKANK